MIETTTGKDGSTTRTETKPDGSSVTERKDANGSTGTVKTDKDGNTRADAKFSDKAVEDAKKSSEAVKVPAEVKAGESSNSAPTVDIDLPKGAGETEIEIPVDDVTPGTVAVIVHPDGTEEIVKDSVVTENGVRLIVDGGATWYEKGQQWATVSPTARAPTVASPGHRSPCSCGPWRRSNTTDITYPRAAHRPPGIFSGAENEQIEKC